MSTDNYNNNDVGNRIQQSVSDALRSGDFSKLNGEITSSVRDVLNDVGDQINSAFNDVLGVGTPPNRNNGMQPTVDNPKSRGFTNVSNHPYSDRTTQEIIRSQQRRAEMVRRQQAQREFEIQRARQRAEQRAEQRAKLAKVRFVEVGSVSGPLNIISGAFISFIFGLATLGSAVDGTDAAGILICMIFTGLGIFNCVKGSNKRKLLETARQYRDLAKEKMYIPVETLAEATGTSQKEVVKNIKKMLSKGFFPEGYLDENNTTFMVSREVYNQYLEAKKNAIITENVKQNETPAAQQQTPQRTMSEVEMVIDEGYRSIEKLRALNNQIPGEVITEKLSRLEQLLGEIFSGLREHPEELPSCRKLMDYYLPTMIKLVEAYAEYDKVSQPGEDIVAAKKEIENTLDIINQAFVELLNKLYQNSVWDVKAEAQVLKTMLHQAGLTEEEVVASDEKEVVDLAEEEEDLLEVAQPALEETVVNNV